MCIGMAWEIFKTHMIIYIDALCLPGLWIQICPLQTVCQTHPLLTIEHWNQLYKWYTTKMLHTAPISRVNMGAIWQTNSCVNKCLSFCQQSALFSFTVNWGIFLFKYVCKADTYWLILNLSFVVILSSNSCVTNYLLNDTVCW